MRIVTGSGASRGIAIGPARLLPPPIALEERRVAAGAVVAELARFEAAIATTDAAMKELGHAATAPPALAGDLVDMHRAILNSDELVREARTLIRERSVGAEWAVRLVVDELRRVFAAMSNERFAGRFEDVEAVADRLLRTLLALPEVQLSGLAGGVGVALELSPLDALQLHRTGIVGFVTERGGATSHAVIVARTLGIPYVFGVERLLDNVSAGVLVCVDGTRGEVIIDPDAPTQAALARRRDEAAQRALVLDEERDAPAITLDGTPLQLGANVESAGDVAAALAAGADHVGLVRTELGYLHRGELPSEEEQLRDALALLDAAGGRPVTFRTLDVGCDKLPLGMRLAAGSNPALGLRGIRLSLRRPALFRTQLRALYRAATRGPMRILFPMVSSALEMEQARALCAEVCGELLRAGVEHDPGVPLGAMIETPSAAMTADHLAAVADFLSIGTNDLIHYAFAADRDDDAVAYLYRPMHPSILRLLRHIFEGAAAHGRPVSMCGEMAGNLRYTWILLGLGLRAFSMTAAAVPAMKSLLRKTDLAAARALAHEALQLRSDEEVAALIRERMGGRFALELDDLGVR